MTDWSYDFAGAGPSWDGSLWTASTTNNNMGGGGAFLTGYQHALPGRGYLTTGTGRPSTYIYTRISSLYSHTGTDVDTYHDWRRVGDTESTSDYWLVLRHDGGWQTSFPYRPNNGYSIYIPEKSEMWGGYWYLKRHTGAFETILASDSLSWTGDTDYRIRFKVSGYDLKAKFWQADLDEPTDWMLEGADATEAHSSGVVSFSQIGWSADSSEGARHYLDNLNVLDFNSANVGSALEAETATSISAEPSVRANVGSALEAETATSISAEPRAFDGRKRVFSQRGKRHVYSSENDASASTAVPGTQS